MRDFLHDVFYDLKNGCPTRKLGAISFIVWALAVSAFLGVAVYGIATNQMYLAQAQKSDLVIYSKILRSTITQDKQP